jgi:hypothetical protein
MEGLNEALVAMASLESRIGDCAQQVNAATKSAGGTDKAAKDVLLKYQAQMLVRLKEVRDALRDDDGDVVTIRTERDEAKNEAAQLRKENERLAYRVNHLIKALNEEEAKNSK